MYWAPAPAFTNIMDPRTRTAPLSQSVRVAARSRSRRVRRRVTTAASAQRPLEEHPQRPVLVVRFRDRGHPLEARVGDGARHADPAAGAEPDAGLGARPQRGVVHVAPGVLDGLDPRRDLEPAEQQIVLQTERDG